MFNICFEKMSLYRSRQTFGFATIGSTVHRSPCLYSEKASASFRPSFGIERETCKIFCCTDLLGVLCDDDGT